MNRSVFKVAAMDCPAEESLIRLQLESIPSIRHLEFDLAERRVTVYHTGEVDLIERAIADLKLGSARLSTEPVGDKIVAEDNDQRRTLRIVLAINLAFFAIEITTGLISDSMGLVADSLDMLADAFVYGISLLAVGAVLAVKKRIARTAGYFQMVLAALGFAEVIRRFLRSEMLPDYQIMIIVSVLALIANSICLFLLQQSGSREQAHMKASMIFTSNDIIINSGVIVAGILVHWLNSNKPDLIIGTIVFVIVMRGALRILKLGK